MSKKNNPLNFVKPRTQARVAAITMFRSNQIPSLGTSHTYENSLSLVGDWMKGTGGGALTELSVKRAKKYLNERAKTVSQSTLNKDRLALQALLQQTGKLRNDQRLPVVKADRETVLKSRNYTPQQLAEIVKHMRPHNALATEIAHAAGLRAHEFITIARRDERSPDKRPADRQKFCGRDNHTIYVVTGKGGLTREVSLPNDLAERLEAVRLPAPEPRRDRKIMYVSQYKIGGGQALSMAFTRASKAALEFSNGLHGNRHSYAQQRHKVAQRHLGDPIRAKKVVSQEIGHFRADITDTYLR